MIFIYYIYDYIYYIYMPKNDTFNKYIRSTINKIYTKAC